MHGRLALLLGLMLAGCSSPSAEEANQTPSLAPLPDPLHIEQQVPSMDAQSLACLDRYSGPCFDTIVDLPRGAIIDGEISWGLATANIILVIQSGGKDLLFAYNDGRTTVLPVHLPVYAAGQYTIRVSAQDSFVLDIAFLELPPEVVAGPGPALRELAFATPIRVNAEGTVAFEPSIVADDFGNLYVTAHKWETNEGGQLSSWLKWSGDGGTTWQDLQSPAQLHQALKGDEGDLAIDAEVRLYFIDTYVVDNTISRWQTTEDGPIWESSRPVQGTLAADDRPWLAAQGDGVVYYTGNTAAMVPAPNNLESAEGSRFWFYRSLDQGTTWSAGYGFPMSGWCSLRAGPANGTTVSVACSRDLSAYSPSQILPPANVIQVWTSHDQGTTWSRDELKAVEGRSALGYPSVAFDDAGNQYVAWAENRPDAENQPDRIFMATRLARDDTWSVADVTPSDLRLSIQRLWLAADQAGTVSLVFYGTDALQLVAGCGCDWHLYAMVATHTDGDALWTYGLADPDPIATGPESPYDFITSTFGPEGEMYIAYSVRHDPVRDARVVVQTLGPNLNARA